MPCGKAARYSAAELGADQVETRNAERFHQNHEVINDAVHSPGIIRWHGRGSTKATHIRAHYAIMARKMRHPTEPRCSAIMHAMK
jgi:hypothetical protein